MVQCGMWYYIFYTSQSIKINKRSCKRSWNVRELVHIIAGNQKQLSGKYHYQNILVPSTMHNYLMILEKCPRSVLRPSDSSMCYSKLERAGKHLFYNHFIYSVIWKIQLNVIGAKLLSFLCSTFFIHCLYRKKNWT